MLFYLYFFGGHVNHITHQTFVCESRESIKQYEYNFDNTKQNSCR